MRKRRRRLRRRGRLKRRNVTEKVRNIVGLGLIRKSTFKHFTSQGKNLEEAKIDVLKEFLNFYLHYDAKELDELEIGAMQICQKDNFLYVAFTDFNDIKELHSRVAECKDDQIQVRNFVPPKYFDRYMFLSKRCGEVRAQDKSKKTQLRFNGNDVEVLIKDEGTPEPYKVIDHSEICNIENIPEYDNKIEWKTKKDRITRTNRLQSPNRGNPPSLNGLIEKTNNSQHSQQKLQH